MQKLLLIWLAYLGAVMGLRFLAHGSGAVFSLASLLFVLGGLVGLWLPVIDAFVYAYFTEPRSELSLLMKTMFKTGKYREALSAMNEHKQLKLAMNNVLFLMTWMVLTIFIVTSSPTMLGKGVVMGLGLRLLCDLKNDWTKPDYLIFRLFWPIQRNVSRQELKLVCGVFVVWFGMMSLLVV